jgi:hypothetical protein
VEHERSTVRQLWKPVVLTAFAVSLAGNCYLGVAAADWRVIPAMLFGWFLADVASGIVHMYMDYRPCRPGVGLAELYFYQGSRESTEYLALRRAAMRRIGPVERLVFDFKNHHPRPDALGRRSFFTLTGSTILAGALPVSLLINLAAWLWPIPGWAMAGAATFLLGGALAQYFHSSLHRDDLPAVIVAMRRVGLLMTPAAHAKHHASLRRDFATNNGWSNPLLNPVFAFLYHRKILTEAGLEPH